jgi:HAD superfamily hydrolase (TIGR01549 family)
MIGADGRQPAAVLFDLDDTLLDNSGIAQSIARTCDSIAGEFDLDAAELLGANGKVWRDYWPQVEESCWLGHIDGFAVSLEAWRRTLLACGCADEAIVHSAFEQHRQFGREAQCLFDDARDLLDRLAEADLPLALITNGSSDLQRDKLRVLGIEDRFDVVVISGELGVAKPHPAPFRQAVAQLSVEPGNVWHVGDSLTTDVAGARAAGLFAVWLDREGAAATKGPEPRPDLQICSLSDLAELLPLLATPAPACD